MQKNKLPVYGLFFQLICSIALLIILFSYFSSFTNPYMLKNMDNISDNWQYQTVNEKGNMKQLHYVDTPINEPLIITRTLSEEIPDAALMFKSNHQSINVYLDNELIYKTTHDPSLKNPGMELHFVKLPSDYLNKTIKLEITSPYSNYSGGPTPVYIGDIPSLEAFVILSSITNTLLMVLCLIAGILMMISSCLQPRNGIAWGNFFFGVFSIIWALYLPSSNYIMYQLFDPQMVSLISIGLYFLYPLPLMLYFYFQFNTTRKAFLPVIILRLLFIIVAYTLQATHILDFAEVLNINNTLFIISIVYMIILGFIELKHNNQFIKFTIPWILLTFIISVRDMFLFYTTKTQQDNSLYELAIVTMIFIIWLYNIKEFFKNKNKEKHENDILKLKNELILKNYEISTQCNEEINIMRHDINNHSHAMLILLEAKKYDEAEKYLANLVEQQRNISQVNYSGHYLLNVLLTTRLNILQQQNVTITSNISVPNKLNIDDNDLCSVVINILDNATEALNNIENPDDKWISIQINYKKPYLYISCENAKENAVIEKNMFFTTTKKDKENHGHGIKIIKRIAKKYDGIIEIDHTQKTFKVKLALLLKD